MLPVTSSMDLRRTGTSENQRPRILDARASRMPFVGIELLEASPQHADLQQTSIRFQLGVPNRERVVVGR